MQLKKPALIQFLSIAGLIVSIFILATLPSWLALWTLWAEDGSGYSHGPLVLGVSFWLIYECWHELQNPHKNKYQFPFALCVGFAASIIWSLGYLTGIALLYWASLPIMSAGILIAFSKNSIRSAALAPGLALAFALPLWELLVPILQGLAVSAVSIMLKLLQLPAFIEGVEVSIPGGRFVVEGGCSGVRFLLVSMALTCLWSFLHLRNPVHRMLLISFSILISIISNWMRILVIILIGYQTEMQSSIIYDHGYLGWIIFAFTLIPICGLAFWFEKRTKMRSPRLQKAPRNTPQWQKEKLGAYLCVVALIPLLSRAYVMTLPYTPAPLLQNTINVSTFPTAQHLIQPQLNLTIGRKHTIFGGWKPNFPGIDAWQTYKYTPSKIQILIGHIAKQSQTQELFSSGNQFDPLNPSIQWQQSKEGDFLTIGNIYGQRWITKLYYFVGGETTSAGLSGKLMQLKKTLQKRLDGQIFIVGFQCQSDCQNEKATLESIDNTTVNSWLRPPI